MIRFKEILEHNGKSIAYDYGCLMLYFAPSFWSKLLNAIDKEDLYDNDDGSFGKEDETHVTVLFGFVLDKLDREKLLREMKQLKPVEFTLTNVSKFDNDDKEYAVLKFDVESQALRYLNQYFSDRFEYENEYPDYHPHATIAYVKKEAADKYIKKFASIKSVPMQSGHFVFTGSGPEDKLEVNV